MFLEVNQYATWIPLLAGVLIPLAVALLTKINASAFVKGLVAFVCIGLTALGTYLLDVNQSHTWTGALYAFVVAMFSAAASRYSITGGWADTTVATKTASFGVG